MDEMFKQICKLIRVFAKHSGMSESEALDAMMPSTLAVIEKMIRDQFNNPRKPYGRTKFNKLKK